MSDPQTIRLAPRVKRPTETKLTRRTLVALNRLPDVRALRNNVGKLHDERGVPVRYGLGNGSPDIVGIITWRVASRALAVPFGIEMKLPDARGSPAHLARQRAWRMVALTRGMFCAEARSVQQAVDLVTEWRATIAQLLT